MQKLSPRLCALVLLPAVVLLGWAVPWVQRHDAILAALEPAAGAPAAAAKDDGVKRSHTGKVLSEQPTLPAVTIGGQRIMTAKELAATERQEDLGEDASSQLLLQKLGRKWPVRAYAHNPVRGPLDAVVQAYEFSDLSCVQCMPLLAEADAMFREHKEEVRQVQIHTPVSQFQDTNLAAFYGKVAQRDGKFWAYREALQKLETPTAEKYFETLLDIGVDRMLARKILNSEARRLYRELDRDAALAKNLHIGEPPAYIINGALVGDNGVVREKLATVFNYQYRQAVRQRELDRIRQAETRHE